MSVFMNRNFCEQIKNNDMNATLASLDKRVAGIGKVLVIHQEDHLVTFNNHRYIVRVVFYNDNSAIYD